MVRLASSRAVSSKAASTTFSPSLEEVEYALVVLHRLSWKQISILIQFSNLFLETTTQSAPQGEPA